MIDHLDDLEADFLRFYRIEDIDQLDGPRFMRLAWRVSAYGGVMAMRLDRDRPAPSSPVASGPPASPAPGRRDAEVVSLSTLMFKFPGTVERVTAPDREGPSGV